MDRILFVDDEAFVLRALKRTFELEGFEVVTCGSPAEALKVLQGGLEFQVIGSDYRMPEMTGAEFLQQARTLSPQSFRVLISAVEEFAAAVEAINRGEIHRFILKPWDRGDLVAIVRSAVEDYHLRRRYQEMTALLHSKNAALETLNRELEHRVVERTSNLLDALAAALDQRGAESVHSRRAVGYVRRLAQQMELPPARIAAVEQAALLHDIGKIGIPDSILLKNGPLTPEEWSEMRRHPELGYRILEHVPFLSEARTLILQHHERWDGKGYPLGLAGAEIDLGARIFHLCEAYESVSGDRTYRAARSHEIARAEMVACSGTQFDPEIVAAFSAIPRHEWEALGTLRAVGTDPGPAPLDEVRKLLLVGGRR